MKKIILLTILINLSIAGTTCEKSLWHTQRVYIYTKNKLNNEIKQLKKENEYLKRQNAKIIQAIKKERENAKRKILECQNKEKNQK